jgi:hypothetical protein
MNEDNTKPNDHLPWERTEDNKHDGLPRAQIQQMKARPAPTKTTGSAELEDLRGNIVALLSSDTTYLVPPGVDLIDWYADNIVGLAEAHTAHQVEEAYDEGHKRGLATAQNEVNHARKLQEAYLAAQNHVPPMKILACEHCAEKVKNGEPITLSPDTEQGQPAEVKHG